MAERNYLRNDRGIRVNKGCSSCKHRLIAANGTRKCGLSHEEVSPQGWCRKWKINPGLLKAGMVS